MTKPETNAAQQALAKTTLYMQRQSRWLPASPHRGASSLRFCCELCGCNAKNVGHHIYDDSALGVLQTRLCELSDALRVEASTTRCQELAALVLKVKEEQERVRDALAQGLVSTKD